MNRAEKNLVFWRSLVGLEASFPTLAPVRDEDLLSLMVVDPEQLGAIRSSLGTSQLTQIVIEPGWGCTTLFHYMVKEARDNAMGLLLLPISIDLGALFQKDAITHDGLESEIKRQIIGILIDTPWEQSLNRDYYFDCINYDSSTDLANYKARMRLFLSGQSMTARKLFGQFPWLKGNLRECLNYLLTNLRIQTALYFHLPRDVESQRIRDLVSALKVIIYETGSVDFAAWREEYFCSPIQWLEIGRDFQRNFNVIKYPRYNAAQIYTMLVKRYAPNVPGYRGRNQVSLDSVFAEEFVVEAWPDAQSLEDLITKVRGAMLRRLDCPESDVHFQLKPLESVTANRTLTPESSGPGSPRKRWERTRKAG